jgi:hypothetical protein
VTVVAAAAWSNKQPRWRGYRRRHVGSIESSNAILRGGAGQHLTGLTADSIVEEKT